MCRVTHCCFCVDTERGSFILAIAGIIMGVLQLLSNLGALTVVGIVTAIVGVAINILLLLGVQRKNALFVLIWIIATIVFIVLMVVTLVLTTLAFIGQQGHGHGLEALGPILVYALTVGLEIYFWIVVYSFYRDLKEGGGTGVGLRNI